MIPEDAALLHDVTDRALLENPVRLRTPNSII